MELHEAIRKARKELGLSQQRLAELAGIERKQLSILENGGNITLATIRKIIPHLPNLHTFSISGASVQTKPLTPAQITPEVVDAATKALQVAMQSVLTIVGSLARGRLPDEKGAQPLHDAARALALSLGHTPEEYDQITARVEASSPPQQPMTREAVAELLAGMEELAKGVEDGEDEPDAEPSKGAARATG